MSHFIVVVLILWCCAYVNQLPPAEPEGDGEDEFSADGMEVALPNEDDTEKYQAPPTAPPSQAPPPHRGYAAPHQQRFMVQGRSAKSGPALGASDERLKRELRPVGFSAAGVPMYEWRYKDGFESFGLDSSTRYRGTTAQALRRMGRSDAVIGGWDDSVEVSVVGGGGVLHELSRSGYALVDYSRLDITLTEI